MIGFLLFVLTVTAVILFAFVIVDVVNGDRQPVEPRISERLAWWRVRER